MKAGRQTVKASRQSVKASRQTVRAAGLFGGWCCILLLALSGCGPQSSTQSSTQPATDSATQAVAETLPQSEPTATNLAHRYPVVDTHIDVPYRLQSRWEDVTRATAEGEFDQPRAVAGGLDVPFMSIYTPGEMPDGQTHWQLAHQLIDHVEAMAGRAPEQFALVRTPEAALAARASGRIALAMGMENGSPLMGDLANVARFRERGISYITLAHSKANDIADSSRTQERPNGGLSPFGREVVGEMNRLGVMVDVSHISDEAFWQVLEISKAPPIASHSSARHFTPGFERNMSDEMIQALAARGGLVMINIGSAFLTPEANAWTFTYLDLQHAWLEEHGYREGGPEAQQHEAEYRAAHPYPYADMDDVMAHFLHVIKLVGPRHVGIGSDFDGVGDSLPTGFKTVADYPALADALLAAGLSETDVADILGGNLLRVWAEVLALAEAA